MAAELLKSKVLIPPERAGIIHRQALMDLLDAGTSRKLTLVSAPAGYGKTTLLGAWARSRAHRSRLPTAWLSLDENDDDPVRFLRYFAASLQEIDPRFGDTLPALIQISGVSGPVSTSLLEDLQPALVNLLHSIPGGFVMILDDFHLVSAPAVHRFVASLVDQLPQGGCLVIASRADPPLPLPRLRARGQLWEVRLAQLRFTDEEAARFLEQAVGTSLAGPDILALAERTEGWAAGLQMAAIALNQSTQPADFIREFAGSNRYIMDYLVEEVLERQPEAIQQFLLRTSILERMCAPLCEAVLESRESRVESSNDSPLSTLYSLPSQSILDYLDRSNLFTIPLDDHREWYRYHRLFADLLQKRFQRMDPVRIRQDHLRASRWFEGQGLVREAIDHALAAVDYQRAAGLIDKAAESTLKSGEIVRMLDWVQALPQDTIRSMPRLDLVYAACQVLLGQSRQAVENSLTRLEKVPDFKYPVDVLKAYLAALQSQIAVTKELASRALAGLPPEEDFFRRLANWLLSSIAASESDLEQRVQIIQAVLRDSRFVDNPMLGVNVLCSLAETYIRQANLPLARDTYQQAIHLAAGPDGRILPVAGEAMIGLGHILTEWDELETASQVIEQGMALIRQVREIGLIEGLIALALCRQAQGKQDEADQLLEQARQAAQAFDTTDVDDRMVEYFRMIIDLQQGERTKILKRYESKRSFLEWARPGAPHLEDDRADQRYQAHLFKYEEVAWARICLALDKPGEALAVLDRLQPDMVRQGRTLLVIEMDLLRALAAQAQGDPDEAQSVFERALAAAEPGRLVRLFVNAGKPVIPLLKRAVQNGTCVEYARRLLEAFPEAGPALLPRQAAAPQPALPIQSRPKAFVQDPVEPLSPREVDVLRYLGSSLSAKEIAAQMGVAESTVNSHIKSIYGKLGVHRRLDAVRRAEDLQLV